MRKLLIDTTGTFFPDPVNNSFVIACLRCEDVKVLDFLLHTRRPVTLFSDSNEIELMDSTGQCVANMSRRFDVK